MTVRFTSALNYMDTQLVLFRLGPPVIESPAQKLIRAYADGNDMARAKQSFGLALMDCLSAANGDVNDQRVQEMAEFGRRVLKREAESVFASCVNAFAQALERAAKAV